MKSGEDLKQARLRRKVGQSPYLQIFKIWRVVALSDGI